MCLSTQPHLSRQAERELGDVLTADDHLVPSLGPPPLSKILLLSFPLPFPSELRAWTPHAYWAGLPLDQTPERTSSSSSSSATTAESKATQNLCYTEMSFCLLACPLLSLPIPSDDKETAS